VGEGNESFNKLKRINFGGKWGMNDTCTMEKF
jgi:hypothetical protein